MRGGIVVTFIYFIIPANNCIGIGMKSFRAVNNGERDLQCKTAAGVLTSNNASILKLPSELQNRTARFSARAGPPFSSFFFSSGGGEYRRAMQIPSRNKIARRYLSTLLFFLSRLRGPCALVLQFIPLRSVFSTDKFLRRFHGATVGRWFPRWAA